MATTAGVPLDKGAKKWDVSLVRWVQEFKAKHGRNPALHELPHTKERSTADHSCTAAPLQPGHAVTSISGGRAAADGKVQQNIFKRSKLPRTAEGATAAVRPNYSFLLGEQGHQNRAHSGADATPADQNHSTSESHVQPLGDSQQRMDALLQRKRLKTGLGSFCGMVTQRGNGRRKRALGWDALEDSEPGDEEHADGDSNAGVKSESLAVLKQRCKDIGLPVSGTKATLLARLAKGKPSEAAASTKCKGAAKKGTRKANGGSKGGRKNFVRISNKGGRGGRKFVGRRGQSNKPGGKKQKWRSFQPKRLAQAGDAPEAIEEGSLAARQSRACFKCGKPDHWAKDCPGIAAPALSDQEQGGDPKDAPRPFASTANRSMPPSAANSNQQVRVATPAFAIEGGRAAAARQGDEAILQGVAREVFGHQGFRHGQLPVIQRVLAGVNTLAILPTGAGKSLCWQLPAAMTKGLVLVVSPLLALMQDQLAKLPACIPSAMLGSSLQPGETQRVLADVRAGQVRLLHVAPERLQSPQLLQALAPHFPLPLVVLDEAHCLAEWGHNFRSAYYRAGRLLRQHIPCDTVLAVTATATPAVQRSITAALGIEEANVIRDASTPPNLSFAVTHLRPGTTEQQARQKLLQLLGTQQYSALSSIIVYTTFQMQADLTAKFLQANRVKAASYHAGQPSKARQETQTDFCKGKLRIIVATVAFGMGLDCGNVGAVIHLNMPRNLAEYVQQVGRAGRSGKPALCHLYLADSDFLRLHSLAHADSLDAATALQFLQHVFAAPEDLPEQDEAEGSFWRVLAMGRLSTDLDVKEAVLETLLSYLEAHETACITMHSPMGTTTQVAFYNTTPSLLADKHNIIRALLTVKPKPRNGCYTVPTERLACAAGVSPAQVWSALKELASREELRFETQPPFGVVVKVCSKPQDLEGVAQLLVNHHAAVSALQVRELESFYQIPLKKGDRYLAADIKALLVENRLAKDGGHM
ncbi:hypothetical protein WJX73_003215 [Symbiochloris irregularis]|uniref:DNA 3'-5' helicase n=1 Tax=Symbiochloris irregularis TaxID=706552 RepID=A0AAW1NWE6_9CHLO